MNLKYIKLFVFFIIIKKLKGIKSPGGDFDNQYLQFFCPISILYANHTNKMINKMVRNIPKAPEG